MINKTDYVELGLACADVCRALDRGMKGRRVGDLGQSIFEAIEQLMKWVQPVVYIMRGLLTALSIRTVAEIQEKVIEKGGRNLLSRLVNAKNDKEAMVTWKADLNRVLQVFNVCLAASLRQLLTTPLPPSD